jgi:uncharacterized damage-inducible protein DinB
MKRYALSIGALLFAAPVFAQAPGPVTAVGTTRTIWEQYAGFNLKSAEQMPEADYAFKPVSTVRSFGEIIGHIAGAQYSFCAAAMGEKPRGEGDIEKTVKTKAGLIAALKESGEYCRKAYAMSDADAAGMTKIFGMDQSKLWVLGLNATHIGEHYGNLVTYQRIKGLVPPSSQPGQ